MLLSQKLVLEFTMLIAVVTATYATINQSNQIRVDRIKNALDKSIDVLVALLLVDIQKYYNIDKDLKLYYC